MKHLYVLLSLFAFVAGCGQEPTSNGPVEPERSEQLWTCGMHPQVVQSEPGACPICGMDLTPMGGSTAEAGAVHIDPVVVQNMGVRTSVVERQPIFRHLRTIGEVDVAEDEVSVVNLRYDGWVERIHVDRTGDLVKRGQRLFEIYSPQLVAAQEELLLALRSGPADSALARSARRKLDLWNVASNDVEAIVDAGEASRTLPVRAPADGYVLHKDIVEGGRVKAGSDLYRIGDLSSIWVSAEVYEFDAPWVQVGQPAQMELSFQRGTVLEGQVAYIYPTLNERSRTLRVRLEFENPGVALKPGMFTTVYIEYRRLDDVLAIPTEAILHSGERELVFVALGEGRFAAREVTTGLEADHHLTEVLSGLEQGEVVVTSGQFLIDSESQLQEAIAKLLAVRSGEAEEGADRQEGEGLYTCPMHPEVVQEGPGRCPECGMFLEPMGDAVEAAHEHADHGGAP